MLQPTSHADYTKIITNDISTLIKKANSKK